MFGLALVDNPWTLTRDEEHTDLTVVAAVAVVVRTLGAAGCDFDCW